MNAKLAEDKIFDRRNHPLLYLVKEKENAGPGKIVQSRSGIFYVLIIIVIFLSMGILLNIGLKIQEINHERKILEINEMISIEKERTDRVQLKIAELKSPVRIIAAAENDLGMQISDDLKIMKIGAGGTKHEDIMVEYITKNTPAAAVTQYDNFLGTIYSIKDIVMVVSEGVLTFFIP
jgi:cell division protein FtsL